MKPNLVDEILAWPEAIAGCDLQTLTGHLSGRRNQRISFGEVEEALTWLAARELVERQGSSIWLSEPDRPELELYDGLEAKLIAPSILDALGVQGREFIFQKTASGGGRGDGPLTRPDFTLAAIQSWRFDPRRTLEVFSFEVKNRAGTMIQAVYEAVAHGRLVHYPYLVCPRSALSPQMNQAIRTACVRESVGLIVFDIVADNGGIFYVQHVDVVEKATRRSPDPFMVQRHLANRLSAQNCQTLEAFAKGLIP